MVILWTDALIFILIAIMLALALYMRGKEHIKRPMQQIYRSKIGMVSLMVLVFFVLIGLMDSVHFKSTGNKTNEIISLLDYWATPLREHGEKTYSAPFATTLYSKEMMTLADGTTQWGYPRLEFGGGHLDNPETQHIPDILKKGLYGFAQGAGLVAFFMLLLWAMLAGQHKQLMWSSTAKAVWAVVFVIVSLSYTLIYLSAYYHVLGTDKVGEDVFYQAVKSIRTGLVIGTLTTLIMLPMAIIFGILAGFFRGWIDDVIQYIYTTLNSIPGVLLIAASILMVQVYMANHEEAFTSVVVRADMRLLFLCLILGVTSWTGLCRLLRAETLKLREMEYVQAAQALGVKQGVILL
ncbi:MAG: ABC transporter permease subunit, partial [Methylobacter sp.]